MQLEDKKALLKKFSKLVIEANHKHNLTAYKHHETFYKEQINDCLKAKEVCLKVCEKTIVDYGSGAGLPGLVWAVVDQNLKLVNVDSNLKKVEFQKNLIRKLLISIRVRKALTKLIKSIIMELIRLLKRLDWQKN